MSPGNVYLVLGGETHIGRHIVQRLHNCGDVVSSFGRQQKYEDVPFYPGDVCNKADIVKAIKLVRQQSMRVKFIPLLGPQRGATCIFHCISPLSTKNRDNLPIFHKVNTEGTQNVIEAALEADVAKLIYHSSSGVIFSGKDILKMRLCPTPIHLSILIRFRRPRQRKPFSQQMARMACERCLFDLEGFLGKFFQITAHTGVSGLIDD